MTSKPLSGVDDPRLARALSHPLRVRILALLERGVASPAQLAPQLSASLGVVAYHVRALERAGLITLERTGRVRGAIQHFYRAVERPSYSIADWIDATPVTKQALVGATTQQIAEGATNAAASGGFDRDEAQLFRTGFVLDDTGWSELAAACTHLREQLDEIERRSVQRAGEPAESQQVTACFSLLAFDAPRTP